MAVRYIGHLYKTFLEMKKEGKTEIHTGFFSEVIDGEQILCIRIDPPQDRRIIFPMDTQIVIEKYRATTPEGEVYLLPRVKNGMLAKIECYPSYIYFKKYTNGTFFRGVEENET